MRSSARKLTDTGIEHLVASLLRQGVYDPDYFREECGRQWALAASMDPKVLWETTLKGTAREGERYSVISHEKYANRHKRIGKSEPERLQKYVIDR